MSAGLIRRLEYCELRRLSGRIAAPHQPDKYWIFPTNPGAFLSEKSDTTHQPDRNGAVAVGKVRPAPQKSRGARKPRGHNSTSRAAFTSDVRRRSRPCRHQARPGPCCASCPASAGAPYGSSCPGPPGRFPPGTCHCLTRTLRLPCHTLRPQRPSASLGCPHPRLGPPSPPQPACGCLHCFCHLASGGS